ITTTEWADELVGGVFSAGPSRLEAAAKCGVPAIVTPACLDMVNFNAPDTVPAKFSGRTFYQHNPNVTLMRTSVEECKQLGRIMAEKLNKSTAPVTVLLPLKGVSMIDLKGQAFYLPEANQALFDALKENLRTDIPVIEMDCDVNDPAFAKRCAEALLENIQGGARK
ncbi:MAG: Tm-1-like ATP-binding domain-containing protein, partial [Phycisphaerae bacterium]|nr:Tm-1-like ATP-binding domain-containing protein [Phycisphaerae bacterium]